jgi:hypothetical protein
MRWGKAEEIISNWKPYGKILVIFLVIRILLGMWMWDVRQLFPSNPAGITPALYMGIPVETISWLEPWQRWDTPQYQAIATHAYTAIHIWKKLPQLYRVYSVTLMLLFVTRLGSPQPLVSTACYVLGIFPAFLLLAVLGRQAWVYRLVLHLSLLGLLFFSAQFAIWGWVG